MDLDSAHVYLASHLSWDDEPALTDYEQDRLVVSALSGSDYPISLLNAAIIQGLEWKLAKAVEYHEDDESKIFDHLMAKLEYWRSIVLGTSSLATSGVYAGGISVSDKDARVQNSDRVTPSFTVGIGQTFSNKISNWSV